MPPLGLMSLVLQVANEHLVSDAINLPEPGMILGDPRIMRRKLTHDALINIIETIQLTTNMLLITNKDTHQFRLLASYQRYLKHFKKSLKRKDYLGVLCPSKQKSI